MLHLLALLTYRQQQSSLHAYLLPCLLACLSARLYLRMYVEWAKACDSHDIALFFLCRTNENGSMYYLLHVSRDRQEEIERERTSKSEQFLQCPSSLFIRTLGRKKTRKDEGIERHFPDFNLVSSYIAFLLPSFLFLFVVNSLLLNTEGRKKTEEWA